MAQWSWADKAESSPALAPGACASDSWDSLSASGKFIRAYVRTATRPMMDTRRNLRGNAN